MHALVLAILLAIGAVSVAESGGWQVICTTTPGKTYDYCRISRTVVHRFSDGTEIKVLVVAGYSKDFFTRSSESRVTVSVGNRRLSKVSIKIDSLDQTVQCSKNAYTFDKFWSTALIFEFLVPITKPAIAIMKLRMLNPPRITVVKLPLKGFREKFRSTVRVD
ncbi:MAG: hypothetical protein O7I42_02515 [Alphaproteobacteria bacterium]|nr:hypothetical protein [Alphaproteobacteria bacterium]